MAVDLDQLAAFVGKWEGFRSRVYLDAVGVPTIGYGETRHDIIERYRKTGITEWEAKRLLKQRLADFAYSVDGVVKVPLSPEQHLALTSLAYNIGTGAFAKSTLVRVLNQGQYGAAADQFLRWDRAGGATLPGLTNRRKAERSIFLEAEKRKRWEARLERVRADAAKHGWTLRRRIYARTLKALIGART